MQAETIKYRQFISAVLVLGALLLLQDPALAQTNGTPGASAANAAKSCAPAELRQQLAAQFAHCPRNMMTMVIGYNPGGNTDTVGRHFQAYLESVSTDSGAIPPAFSTVIESRPGASGEIGSRLVAEGDAKTCRLLIAQSNQLTTNQLGVPNAINPETDLKSIAMIAEAPLVLAVNARTSPHKSFADFQKYIKAGGDRNFFGSNGHFATDHLAMETMLGHMGAKATHVPFTGSGPMIQSLLVRNDSSIDFALVSVGLIRAYLLDGRLQALGVARPQAIRVARGAGEDDLVIEPIARHVPQFSSASMWVALAGNRHVPDSLSATMTQAVQCFAQSPKAQQVLAKELMFELGGSRDALMQRVRSEITEARARFSKEYIMQVQNSHK